jgi:hypothetical protein
MATRSGGATLTDVGRLQEARKSLEDQVGFPVAASIGKDLRLLAFPRNEADQERLKGFPTWKGFLVEVRDTPRAA